MEEEIPPYGNPVLRNSIPEVTLPRVTFPTTSPYHIEVNIEDVNNEVTDEFSSAHPPFFPVLQTQITNPEAEPELWEYAYEIYFVQGYIYSYHGDENDGDAMSELLVTEMPLAGASVEITAGQKCYVSAEEDAYGNLSDPEFFIANDWPESIPPKLVGGNDQTGSPGSRVWRLAEVVETTVGDLTYLKLVIHRTGIIEHRLDRRPENLQNDISQDEGRVYAQFDKVSGEYKFRTLLGKRGVRILEGENGESDYLKVMMPEGVNGAVLYYHNGNVGEPEIGEWTKLDPPSVSPEDGFEWVLKNVVDGPPAWIQIQKLPTGILDDMLVHDGTKWVTFAAPTDTTSTYIHAYQGGHVWLATEECDSPPA